MKHNVDDFVLIYSDTPTFKDGALGKIIDRDTHDKSYLVAPLEDVLKCEGDTVKLLEYGKWVEDSNFKVITFDRPNKLKSLLMDIPLYVSLLGMGYLLHSLFNG